MTTVGWKIVFLSFGMYASAQMLRDCGTPSVHLAYTTLDRRFLSRQKFSSGEKVYYDCADGFTTSKGSRAVQCVHGRWTPLTLKCEKKSCGNAGDLLNGQLMYEGTSVGDKVFAVCNPGFTLKGMKYLICKSSGWTGEFPSCEDGGAPVPVETTCSSPAVANSVKRSGDALGHHVGDTVTFSCNQGFKLDGAQQVTCGPSGQWEPQLPQCLRSNDVTCDAPKAQLQNTLIVVGGLKPLYKQGETLSFLCKEPYRLTGSATTTCGLSGSWTPRLPKCTWALCPELMVPHSRASSKRRRVDSVVTVRCHRGYYQKGPSTVVCLKNETWSAIPECVSRIWTKTCSKPVVANAVKSTGDAAVHRVGDSVTFTCNQGFQLNGSQQVTCSSSGQWQPQPPTCLPSSDQAQSPQKGRCGVPVDYRSNTQLTDNYITMTSFASGAQVHYMCAIGYAIRGGSRSRRCIDGKWTPLLLKCERKSCGSAGEILNGQFVYNGAEFGDTATALCDEGFQLVGRGTRTCMNDGWDGRVAICEAVQCEEPPQMTNAERTGALGPPYVYNSVLSYRCRAGTLIGQREIWCNKDGTWSAPPPTCQEIICPVPNVPNASRMGALQAPYKYRDTISFQCNWGYRMSGSSSVSCGANGQWSPDLPNCTYHGAY